MFSKPTLITVLLLFILVVALSCVEACGAASIGYTRAHAKQHCRYLGISAPTWVADTDDQKRLQKYVKRTWKRIRHPQWQGLGAKAWLPLCWHEGWPRSQKATMLRVITRESGGNPTCVGGTGGMYYGLFQIYRGHSPNSDLLNPNTNINIALEQYHARGWIPWSQTAY